MVLDIWYLLQQEHHHLITTTTLSYINTRSTHSIYLNNIIYLNQHISKILGRRDNLTFATRVYKQQVIFERNTVQQNTVYYQHPSNSHHDHRIDPLLQLTHHNPPRNPTNPRPAIPPPTRPRPSHQPKKSRQPRPFLGEHLVPTGANHGGLQRPDDARDAVDFGGGCDHSAQEYSYCGV